MLVGKLLQSVKQLQCMQKSDQPLAYNFCCLSRVQVIPILLLRNRNNIMSVLGSMPCPQSWLEMALRH